MRLYKNIFFGFVFSTLAASVTLETPRCHGELIACTTSDDASSDIYFCQGGSWTAAGHAGQCWSSVKGYFGGTNCTNACFKGTQPAPVVRTSR